VPALNVPPDERGPHLLVAFWAVVEAFACPGVEIG
jgi:hypothetical protein